MYRLSASIPNDMALNLIPEVAFNPSGSIFAVSHQQSNEVVLYDAGTRTVLRVFKNPDAGLDNPHGVLLSEQHLIVSNTHGVTRPSSFSIYNLHDSADRPVSVCATPFPHLREAHSLARHNDILAVSYCQNVEGPGALVSYRYDDAAGVISGPITVRESCFGKFGQPKGVAVSAGGSEVYCTYATQKRMTGLPNYLRRLKAARMIWKKRSLADFSNYLWAKSKKRFEAMQAPMPEVKNGIAIFAVNNRGELSDQPVRVLERETFCRLENIDIVGDTVILCDTINGQVYLHDLAQDPQLAAPVQTISESVVLPHGAKLSPDLSMLVVTNYGLKVENQIIHWMTPGQGYTNSVLVYERHTS